MDALYIGGFLFVIGFMTWFAWRVGEDKAARMYQAELANERSKVRRLTRDLELSREETAMVRRVARGGGA